MSDLKCYCCGAEIGNGLFTLVALDKPTDRVFVMLPEHADNVDDATNIVIVQRAEFPKS